MALGVAPRLTTPASTVSALPRFLDTRSRQIGDPILSDVAVTAPSSLIEIAARIDTLLADLLAGEHRRWSDFDLDLADPVAEIERLVLGGGKRLRPAFCHWGYVGMGGSGDDETVVRAGGALELLHVFALFHDDVIDDADTRRGKPTTHTVFADRHRRGSMAGEPRRFGEGMAILIGDLTFVYADQLLGAANAAAWKIWNELRVEVSIGQILDVVGSAQGVRDVAQAERIATYKSAKYTIERPLHLGAALAAPDRFDEVAPAFSAYGIPLGLAFQMRDDVMGAFGDSATTGKPVGDDLLEGKPTPMLARAVAAATPAQAEVLASVGAPGLTPGDIETIQETIRATGALAVTETEISSLTDAAIAAIQLLPVSDEARHQLDELARFVSQREV